MFDVVFVIVADDSNVILVSGLLGCLLDRFHPFVMIDTKTLGGNATGINFLKVPFKNIEVGY